MSSRAFTIFRIWTRFSRKPSTPTRFLRRRAALSRTCGTKWRASWSSCFNGLPSDATKLKRSMKKSETSFSFQASGLVFCQEKFKTSLPNYLPLKWRRKRYSKESSKCQKKPCQIERSSLFATCRCLRLTARVLRNCWRYHDSLKSIRALVPSMRTTTKGLRTWKAGFERFSPKLRQIWSNSTT